MTAGNRAMRFAAGLSALGLLLVALPAAQAFAGQTIEIVPTVDGHEMTTGPVLLEAGRTVSLGVSIADARSGFPLGDLHPAFWVRPATPGRDACAAAADRYLSLGPNAGVDDDLNGYLFATLNADHSIGVMDPNLNLATSNLLSLTPRDHPADAWWLDQARARLFVASATAGGLQVLDLLSGELAEAASGLEGARSIAVFPDIDRLWVAGDHRLEAIALETRDRAEATTLPTGAWQIEADRTGLRLLALDHRSGRFLILHPASGAVEREILLGGRRRAFVHDARGDAVHVLAGDGASLERLFLDADRPSRHPLPVAVDQLLLTADGDWLAGLNGEDGSLVLIDAASLRPVHVLRFDGRPNQMRASADYLYLLESGTGYASLVHLPSLTATGSPGVLRIPVGPPAARGDAPRVQRRDGSAPGAIAPLIEGGGAIIASASDRSLYLYMETGMQAPANAFKSWTAAPTAVALLDRRPRERRAGRYETAFRPRSPGAFELVVYLPSPKAVRCFELAVAGDGPDLAEALRPPRLVWIRPDRPIVAGRPVELRFRLDGSGYRSPTAARRPAQVLALASGRNWHWRGHALPLDDRRFALSLALPEPGSYQLLVRAPDRQLDFADQRPFSVDVVSGR